MNLQNDELATDYNRKKTHFTNPFIIIEESKARQYRHNRLYSNFANKNMFIMFFFRLGERSPTILKHPSVQHAKMNEGVW